MGKRENDITEAMHNAVNCFAMAKVLEKRILRIECINQKIALMGTLFPAGIGVTTLNFDKISELLNIANTPLETILAILIIIFILTQTLFSAYSATKKWNENLPIYVDSKNENFKNARKYYRIWKRYLEDEEKYSKQLEETNTLNDNQQKIDQTINITEKERRYGMRHALRQYKIQPSVENKEITPPAENNLNNRRPNG